MSEDEVKTDSNDTTSDAKTQNEKHDRLNEIVDFDVRCRMTRRHANALVCALKQMEHNADMRFDTIVGIATSFDGHDMGAHFEINGFEAEPMIPNRAGLVAEDGNPRIVFDPAGDGSGTVEERREFFKNCPPDNEAEARLREFLQKNGYLSDNWLKTGLSNIVPIDVDQKQWDYAYCAGLSFPEADPEADGEDDEQKVIGYIPGFDIMETADTYWHLLKVLETRLTAAIDDWAAAGKELPAFPRTFEEMFEMCRGKMMPVSWVTITSSRRTNGDEKEESCQ